MLSFLVVAMLPTILIATTSLIISFQEGQEQVYARLESIHARKTTQINTWIYSMRQKLAGILNEQASLGRPKIVLTLAQTEVYYDFYLGATRTWFIQAINQNPEFIEIFVLNNKGTVLLSTNIQKEGIDFSQSDFFIQSMTGEYFAFFPFSPTPPVQVKDAQSENLEPTILISLPVIDENGESIGLMAGILRTDGLEQIINENTSHGKTGQSIIVNESILISSEGKIIRNLSEMQVPSEYIETTSHLNNEVIYRNYKNLDQNPVIGFSGSIPDLNAKLIVEMEQSEAFQSIFASLRVNIFLILSALVLAIVISTLTSKRISRPLSQLVEGAKRIARGNLNQPVPIKSNDEIGEVSLAFNAMSNQLQTLINDLEEKVEQRTEALRVHVFRLEMLAEISREITSILAIDNLTERVIESIRNSFQFRTVNLYLWDEEKGCFHIITSPNDQGKQNLPLEIEKEEIFAICKKQTMEEVDLALKPIDKERSLKKDACTRLFIPMLTGERIIGAIEIQNQQSGIFSPEEKLILQSLADQIAIALENARHYNQARQVATLEERQRIARDLHDSIIQSLYSISLLAEGGIRSLTSGNLQQTRENFIDLRDAGKEALKNLRLMTYAMRPPDLQEAGLIGAVQQRLDSVETRVGIETRLLVAGKIDLPDIMEEMVYFVALEALNNALKHAGATEIKVMISQDVKHFQLKVIDNGKGFLVDSIAKTTGMGLVNMRQRVEEFNGAFNVLTKESQGTTIMADFYLT